jgi:hypothetical protein
VLNLPLWKICLTPHIPPNPKPGHGFLTSHVVILLCSVSSVKTRGDWGFGFFFIGGIVDHHCLNFLFII